MWSPTAARPSPTSPTPSTSARCWPRAPTRPLPVADGRRQRDESGMTLVELMVSTAMLGVVLSIFFGVLVSVQTGLVRQTDRSRSNDQARLAVEEIDREV